MKMDELEEIRKLAGLDYYAMGAEKDKKLPNWKEWTGSNPSKSAHEKVMLMKKYKIEPGTPDWFRLWFARPYMTGEAAIHNERDFPTANQK